MKNCQKIICVVGASGSGKTKLAIEIAKVVDGIIISADSRQVYKGLDIGTNKEGAESIYEGHGVHIVDGIPQFLIDIADPSERFTLADWLVEAKKILKLAQKWNKTPIIVGGTGLYVTALTDNYDLKTKTINPNNDYQSLILKTQNDRQEIYQKSDNRIERIFDSLVEEVKNLINNGVSTEWLDSLGLDYRFATRFVLGQLNRKQAINKNQFATHAYIRRQEVWWRHHGQVKPVKTSKEAIGLVKDFLTL